MLEIVYLERYRQRLKIISLFVALLLPVTSSAATQWRMLAPGLAYTKLRVSAVNPWAQIHAFLIDVKHYQLAIAFATEQRRLTTTVRHLVKANQALLAVNGGFFTPELKPIGLRIQNGKVKHRLKNTSWWGVFYSTGSRSRIVAQRSYRFNRHINFSVQGGPRLIINGIIPRLKTGYAERTAIGITRGHQIVLLATEHAPLTTTQLAEIMRRSFTEGGLNCVQALNLDGGRSTQLYAKINDLELYIPGFSAITDAILVFPRRARIKKR